MPWVEQISREAVELRRDQKMPGESPFIGRRPVGAERLMDDDRPSEGRRTLDRTLIDREGVSDTRRFVASGSEDNSGACALCGGSVVYGLSEATELSSVRDFMCIGGHGVIAGLSVFKRT